MPMPTIPGVPPETWEQILQILAQLNTSVVELGEQGITTFEQLRQWLTLQGYELVEISEVVGYTIAKTEAVDPATTNAVANRVATDIVATGGAGTAVTQFVSGGNRTLGLVAKGVAVGACLSLLISTIGAGLVSDEIKEDLITSADPYTIDGENVPVLIDENGKTHFLEEMVEAIRAKAIELGIFNGGEDEHIESDTSLLRYTNLYDQPIYAYKMQYGVIYSAMQKQTSAYRYEFRVQEDYANDVYYVLWLGTGNTNCAVSFMSKSPYTIEYRTVNVSTGVATNWTTLTATTRSNASGGSNYPCYRTNSLVGSSDGDLTGFTNLGKFNRPRITVAFNSISSSNNDTGHVSQDYAQIILYGETGTGGVEGITPAQDLITAGVADVTKPLTEVLPQLAAGQMSIASPNENDLTHKSNWYPVSINSEDVFTDGVTEEETSTATDGDVKEDLQPAILDAINELIKQLNPDGTPDIPVSDSGDTPPENPPLTPSSGANGSNGLWAIYNPTLAQVQDFGAWLWSDSLADQFKRIFNSPIDGVIGFHMLYCTPSRGADQTIKCGFLASPVTSRTVSSPYVEIDCGTVNIGEFYRNALDYDYTRISVYLPFIGIIPLDTNIVMGSDLNITYRVDVLTGTCLAQIKVIKENSDAVMYAFEGNCAVQIPLTATTYTGMVGALMSGVSAGIGVMTGNIAQAVTSGANALANMVSGKSGVKQSGTMGANAGALGIRKPYVIITHPIAYMPIDFNKLEGLPSNITAILGTLTGFTRVRSVHLENIGTATQEEINMIEELLKEGVII